jgi:phage shock protein A
LTQIADQNKEIGNDATTRRKWLSQEINDTHEYLVWIQQRRAEILARQTELEAQRCTNS